jgi:hypothetical protein
MAKAKLIELQVEDRPGTLAAVAAVLADARVNVLSIVGWGPMGAVQILVDNPRKAMKALAAAGIAHSEGKADMAELPNRPGSLHGHLAKLAKKGVNIRSINATTTKSGKKSLVIWTV